MKVVLRDPAGMFRWAPERAYAELNRPDSPFRKVMEAKIEEGIVVYHG